MTRSISAVAVCLSSASLVSLNRRAFWTAMTAWSAKDSIRLSLLLVERRRIAAGGDDGADAFPSQSIGARDREL